ncbi:family 16 glycoside hydrolase [Rubritalea marina]|uniref:family 16 glycoside hydrolase n=1 Tax=Rubritalea marina TaxID=361055 RepID=UPI000380A1CF|nr:family 16 glycoside hydrolase [Rubritalea marina]
MPHPLQATKPFSLIAALCISTPAITLQAEEKISPSDSMIVNGKWNLFGEVVAHGNSLRIATPGDGVVANVNAKGEYKHGWFIASKDAYQDLHLKLDFLLPERSNSGVYFMGRYEIQLLDSYGKKEPGPGDLGGLYQRWDDQRNPKGFDGVAPRVNAAKPAGEWQTMEVTFRAPRFAADGTKTHHAKFLKVLINDQLVQENTVAKGPTRSAIRLNETSNPDRLMIQGDHGPVALRNIQLTKLKLSTDGEPALSGEEATPLDSKGRYQINAVDLGKDLFKSKGCAECHSIKAGENKTGPSLHGLFTQSVRETKIYIPSEGHHKTTPADLNYLKSSMRRSMEELAYQADGTPYLPTMPPFSFKLINNNEANALYAYLKTLNPAADAGPSIQWVEKPSAKYVLKDDPIAIWVKDTPKLERVDSGENVSGRTYHVGLPGDINYSFDPRTLAIAQVWDGPFLRKLDQVDRGRGGAELGFQNRNYGLANLFQPLDAKAKPVDLTYTSPARLFDPEQAKAFLADTSDVIQTIEALPGRFLGVDTPKQGIPSFRYQVGDNQVKLRLELSHSGKLDASFDLDLKSPLVLTIPADKLQNPNVSLGELKGQQWTIPAGKHQKVSFSATLPKVQGELYTSELSASESHQPQPLTWKATEKPAKLPPGYQLEVGNTPNDPFGRPLVFEAMGIEFHEGDTYVSTRTAGIWKVVDGQWKLFADGTYDSLGLVVNSSKEVVIGEKPGITRLIDADGDDWAERREVITEKFRFNGDYHEYLHGPIKQGDSYLFSLNLGNEVKGMYKAGGEWMGTAGGLRGWMLSTDAQGNTRTFASGFRSPAGLALSPNNEIVYTENQGEYVGTSKVFIVEQDKFYGNPTGLIDQKGYNTESPEVQWDAVKATRELPVMLLPHQEVMNAPGSPEWVTEAVQFGPFQGQMLLGDQLQSNIYRIDVQEVAGKRQAAAMPFMEGLDSGAMRLRFNPADSSLWIGQTGRGWRAKGGESFGFQRITFDPATQVEAIHTVEVTPTGFEVIFTQAQPEEDVTALAKISSCYYMNNATYGSPKHGERQEKVSKATWNQERTKLSLQVENFAAIPSDNPEASSRVYRIDLSRTAFGKAHGTFFAKAYYTLHALPKANN